MKMVKIEELKANLDLGKYAEYLNDYRNSTTHICDAISEIADNNTSIYYSDIRKFISENVEAVNDAISEFGWDGCGADLYKAGQMAEYSKIERDIYEHLSDGLVLCAYDYMLYDLKIEAIPGELANYIEDCIDEVETDSAFDTVTEIIMEWFTAEPETALDLGVNVA